jgi:rhodanese-related sulfurtransferase
MKSIVIGVVAALALSATACKNDRSKPEQHAGTKVTMVSVDQVDSGIAANQCTAVDANNESTREKMGIVPGAIRLTSYDGYDLSELPPDKSRKLIFYCANTQCGASHTAAERALTAGYQNVEVMGEGIAGWVNAGKKVDKI